MTRTRLRRNYVDLRLLFITALLLCHLSSTDSDGDEDADEDKDTDEDKDESVTDTYVTGELKLPNGDIVEQDTSLTNDTEELSGPAMEPRVVRGKSPRSASEVAYQVAVIAKKRGIICGGALVNPNTVITAAHCVNLTRTKVTDYAFLMGKTELRQNEKYEYLTSALSVHVHPYYDPRTYLNDIAIFKLKDSVCYNEGIQPILLPPPQYKDPSKARLRISGWGYTKKRPVGGGGRLKGRHIPVFLKVAYIQYIESRKCAKLLNEAIASGGYYAEHRSRICAGQLNTERPSDTCQYDSGGPLSCVWPDKTEYLCGIVNAGFGCGQKNTPGMYTNISQFRDWILSFGFCDPRPKNQTLIEPSPATSLKNSFLLQIILGFLLSQ